MIGPPRSSPLFPTTPLSRPRRAGRGSRRSPPSGCGPRPPAPRCRGRSEEHTSELQSHLNLVCRLLLEKKKKINDVCDPQSDTPKAYRACESYVSYHLQHVAG